MGDHDEQDASAVGVGQIGWIDLTVPDGGDVCDFYRKVVGWTAEAVDMGGYCDYCMTPPGASGPVAGICHQRDSNASMPAQWMIYITVADLDASAARCRERGGTIVVEPRGAGSHGRFCVIRDPAGAVAALFEPATPG